VKIVAKRNTMIVTNTRERLRAFFLKFYWVYAGFFYVLVALPFVFVLCLFGKRP